MFEIGSLLTLMDDFQIRVFTWRKGQLAGTDQAGNRYYRARRTPVGRRERRWVVYDGTFDPSKVPPEWFGWLHHYEAQPIPPNSPFHQPWIKPHAPNQSGTSGVYRQPGHPLKSGQRGRVSGDYEPWTPA